MKQLTVKDIIERIEELKKQYPESEVLEMPVYIGDDDELNGIHCAWYVEEVTDEDDYACEMINERAGNIPFKDKALLIS